MTQSSLFASLRVLIGFCLAALICPVAIAQNVAVMKPSPQQIAWQDLEFGVIVHFNPNTWLDQDGAMVVRESQGVQSDAR